MAILIRLLHYLYAGFVQLIVVIAVKQFLQFTVAFLLLLINAFNNSNMSNLHNNSYLSFLYQPSGLAPATDGTSTTPPTKNGESSSDSTAALKQVASNASFAAVFGSPASEQQQKYEFI